MSTRDVSCVREELHNHLKEITTDGSVYVKSRVISSNIDSTPKQVGFLMGEIEDGTAGRDEIEVSRWGRSASITWEVCRQ